MPPLCAIVSAQLALLQHHFVRQIRQKNNTASGSKRGPLWSDRARSWTILRPCQRPLWARYGGGTQLQSEIDPRKHKESTIFFCLHPHFVLFIYTFAWTRARVFVEKFSRHRPFTVLESAHWGGEPCLTPPLCPYCTVAVASIEQWEKKL